jgi:hypothetical protein
MAGVSTPILPQSVKNGKIQIANGDGQNQKTVYTAATNGDKVTSLIAVSTDTSNRDVQVSITNGGTSYPLGTISVVAGAGNTSGVNSVNMLDPTHLVGLAQDSDGNYYIQLVTGDTLTVSALATVTSGKLITVTAPTVTSFS